MKPRFIFALGLLVVLRSFADEPPRRTPAREPIPPSAPLAPLAPLPSSPLIWADPERRPDDPAPAPIPADWPGVEYTEVRAYLYHPGELERNNLIIREDGRLHPDAQDSEGLKLEGSRIAQLKGALRTPPPGTGGRGVGCFDPHHGFVFYDPKGKPVAHLSVCFLCDGAASRPAGGGGDKRWDMSALEALVKELGFPIFQSHDEANDHFIKLAAKWPDTRVKETLDRYLWSGDYSSFEVAQLRALSDRTTPVILSYLQVSGMQARLSTKPEKENGFSRSAFPNLCDILGDNPPASAVPLLAPFLDHPDESIRLRAAEAIAASGSPEAVPLLRKALATSDEEMPICILAGLEAALKSAPEKLHADFKTAFFEDVRSLSFGDEACKRWTDVLYAMDSDRALTFFLSKEVFRADSEDLRWILEGLAERCIPIPREHLLKLVKTLREGDLAEFPNEYTFTQALRLLGQHRHPDDLGMLASLVAAEDVSTATSAGPGLLAWHGLEGYEDRLGILATQKDYAGLNKSRQLYLATSAFESALSLDDYFSSSAGSHWQDALEGLRTLQFPKLAALLEQAIAKFGTAGPAADDATRRKQLEGIYRENPKAFAELDQSHDELTRSWWTFDLALDRFAIEHAADFK